MKRQPLIKRYYEVMAQREGRWLIDCLMRSRASAIARAQELFADERIAAVRVVRDRFSITGAAVEAPIFERIREAKRREPPIMVAAGPTDETWCETAVDLYGIAGRRAIANLLRNFLDRFTITPTELLHDPRHLRPLESQDGLIMAAVTRAAHRQATLRGVDFRARRDAINGFIDAAIRRANAARASKTMPVIGAGGLAGLAEAAAARSTNAAERAFTIRFAVSQKLADANGFGGRLEVVMGWAVPALPPPLLAVIDEFLSGLFGAAVLIRDVIGYQPHFGGMLLAIAELAAGRHDGNGVDAPPALRPLAWLLAHEAMPETRTILIERLQREIASDKPLSREALGPQRQVFDQLLERLIDASGLFAGGTAMVEAIARRSRRLEIVGGVEPVRFVSADAVARIGQLLDLEKETLADRPARALATYMAEILDRFEGDPATLRPLKAQVERTSLPADAKQAILARLQHAAP